MNMFEEIHKTKKDLPKVSNITKQVSSYKYNMYQILAFVIFFISFISGIIFGNLFPACGSTSSFYGDVCMTTEFNVFLMLMIWMFGFLIGVIFFAVGHVVALLTQISSKLEKKI